LNKATDETAGPILTRNITKRVTPHEVRNFSTISQSWGSKSPQKSPKLARIGILLPNPRSRKIAIYRPSIKQFMLNLTDRLKTGEISKICKISSNAVMWGSRDPLLEFWDF